MLLMSLCMLAGLLLTPLTLVIAGLAMFTFGVFAQHAVLSALVFCNRRLDWQDSQRRCG